METNGEQTPNSGCYQNNFLLWMQDQNPTILFGYGIGYCLLAIFGAILGCGLCLGIHTYQDQLQAMVHPIQELSEEASNKILQILSEIFCNLAMEVDAAYWQSLQSF